jgi:hypothetical protein
MTWGDMLAILEQLPLFKGYKKLVWMSAMKKKIHARMLLSGLLTQLREHGPATSRALAEQLVKIQKDTSDRYPRAPQCLRDIFGRRVKLIAGTPHVI